NLPSSTSKVRILPPPPSPHKTPASNPSVMPHTLPSIKPQFGSAICLMRYAYPAISRKKTPPERGFVLHR
ncbi:hypothetical protein, partial [Citrobacter braakii]|uniref:hypothetical protein n=1 Tax=Citrobacter braakii TaxID=57706 RepID=UPI0019553932